MKTSLRMLDDETVRCYNKLKNFLGKHKLATKSGWYARLKIPYNNYTSFKVSWMPKLHAEYRRLTYEEFCKVYNIN